MRSLSHTNQKLRWRSVGLCVGFVSAPAGAGQLVSGGSARLGGEGGWQKGQEGDWKNKGARPHLLR